MAAFPASGPLLHKHKIPGFTDTWGIHNISRESSLAGLPLAPHLTLWVGYVELEANLGISEYMKIFIHYRGSFRKLDRFATASIGMKPSMVI
jgi:hypothetical protein